jgi:hypothetical protein
MSRVVVDLDYWRTGDRIATLCAVDQSEVSGGSHQWFLLTLIRRCIGEAL